MPHTSNPYFSLASYPEREGCSMTSLGLVTDSISGIPIELAKNKFAQVWHVRKTQRFERFLSQLQTEMDRISEGQRRKLNDYIETEEAQDRLTEFADTVVSKSDKRVHIALALLYCNDRDYPLTDKDKHTFCMAVRNIHPALITFYLKLEAAALSGMFDTLPERYTLKHTDLDVLFDGEHSSEEVTEVVTELISLKLLLNDPKSYPSWDEDASWTVSWGMNDSKWGMLRLLRKSQYVYEQNYKN